jgi:hypothetical protein
VLEGDRRKKLTDWVRWITSTADGTGPDLDYCRSCRRKRQSDDPCGTCPEPELLPENLEAVELFLGVQTQWRIGFAGATGLDYAGLEAAARLRGTAMTPDLFARVQVLESAWLRAVERKRSKDPES